MSMDRKNKCGRLTPAPPRLRRCPQLTPLDPSYASLRKAAQLEAQAAARAANGHPGDGGVPAGGPGNGAQGRGSNGSGLGGESGRPFNGQQQQQQQFPQHQQHAPPRPADQSRTGQPHQHPDSSLLTLASLSYQTSSPLAYQQPPGAIGSPRAALSGLDLLNAALSQATLSGGGGSGMGPSTPTTAHNLPGQSQLPSARLPPAPHLSPPPAHRPPFPGSTSHSGSGLFQPSHQTSHRARARSSSRHPTTPTLRNATGRSRAHCQPRPSDRPARHMVFLVTPRRSARAASSRAARPATGWTATAPRPTRAWTTTVPTRTTARSSCRRV
jgi:hypothetical protein